MEGGGTKSDAGRTVSARQIGALEVEDSNGESMGAKTVHPDWEKRGLL